MSADPAVITLETALRWARSGNEFQKVYRFLFLHPDDFFTIPTNRNWSIAHQVVYHGDVELIKRCLALFSDEQIDIRTTSADQKTLLDVATERRTNHPAMYTFMEHLFLQDELIQAAKDNDWRLVGDLLERNPQLINEKPPYSTYYLLHYIIQNGHQNILEDLFRRFQFRTDVLSADNETPLSLAKRLKKTDMCSFLEPTIPEQSNPPLIAYRPTPRDVNLQDKKQTNPLAKTPSAESSPPYPATDPFPGFGFQKILLELNVNGAFMVSGETSSLPNEIQPLPNEQQTDSTKGHADTPAVPVQDDHETKLEPPPITPVSNPQVLKNLTCPLIQQIFVDPVIASDGQTYEREAITEYVNSHHCSPMTGAPMDAKFQDNTEIKQIIRSMGKKN